MAKKPMPRSLGGAGLSLLIALFGSVVVLLAEVGLGRWFSSCSAWLQFWQA
jgi:hypothetical protein